VLRLLADENFNRDIYRGVRLRNSHIEFIRAQDVPITGWRDELVLAWAAAQNRIVVSHDVNTMRAIAIAEMAAGRPMAGVFLVQHSIAYHIAIDQICWLAENADEDEFQNIVEFLPF